MKTNTEPVATVQRAMPCDEMGDQWFEVTHPIGLRIGERLYHESALQAERERAGRWEEEARRYCCNSDYWRERAEKAEAERDKLRAELAAERERADRLEKERNEAYEVADAETKGVWSETLLRYAKFNGEHLAVCLQRDTARDALAVMKYALRNPTAATAGSVRGVLQMLRGKPGVTFDEIKTHCMMRGDDLSWWPQWADEAGASYVTEQGAAMLLLAGMVAPLIKD